MKSKVVPFSLSLAIAASLSAALPVAADETQAELQAQTKISQKEAAAIAIAKVSDGKIKSAELEKENGKLIYSFDISRPHSKNITEIQVDAKTGKLVSTQVETPSDQAHEAAADKKEKK